MACVMSAPGTSKVNSVEYHLEKLNYWLDSFRFWQSGYANAVNYSINNDDESPTSLGLINAIKAVEYHRERVVELANKRSLSN